MESSEDRFCVEFDLESKIVIIIIIIIILVPIFMKCANIIGNSSIKHLK